MTISQFFRATVVVASLFPAFAPLAQAQGKTTELAMPAPSPVVVVGPRVALETNFGRIVLELYPEKAPRTVENFLGYVRSGHYNGTIFHRVIGNLLIQGGTFTADLHQKPDRAPIINEAGNGLSNLRGTVAAARRMSEKDSATSQFYINTVDNPQLDRISDVSPYTAGHAVFGRVLEGMEVVDKIRAVATSARAPLPAEVPKTTVLIERADLLDP